MGELVERFCKKRNHAGVGKNSHLFFSIRRQGSKSEESEAAFAIACSLSRTSPESVTQFYSTHHVATVVL